ncbi:MAG: arginine--tRNA ligase, partial [Nitrosomonadales bacterium]
MGLYCLSRDTTLKQHLTDLFAQALRAVAPETTGTSIILERPKQTQHGDYACNLAMQLARTLKRNPREIASALLDALPASPWVEKAEIAGAGFINIFLSAASKQRVITTILQQGPEFGRGQMGEGKKIQVEFVSANPTGPLHVGHGRGAAFGMSLSNVLAAAGFEVKREYYINDAGRQMDILALSTWLRYLELNGISVPFPANAYQGQYVRDMAAEIRRLHGDRYVHQPWTLLEGVPPRSTEEELEKDEKWAKQQNELHLDGLIANAKKLLGDDYAYIHDFALTEQLGDGRNDLMEFGVSFDTWFSEKSL